MSGGAGAPCAVYELTVAGSLGPVLRAALPGAAVTDIVTTTVRASLGSDAELEDVLALLDDAGVVVQAVFRSSAPAAAVHQVAGSLISDDAGRVGGVLASG